MSAHAWITLGIVIDHGPLAIDDVSADGAADRADGPQSRGRTNTMVYYAGGYRFTDFMKIGIPLIALFCALSMWLIPRFWPLG